LKTKHVEKSQNHFFQTLFFNKKGCIAVYHSNLWRNFL